MAEQHARAVQNHSKITDRLTRNILEIIALDIGRDDRPAKTSNKVIAARARTSVNTARDRIEDILKSKELVRIIEGKYSFYNLNREYIPYDSVAEEAHEDDGLTETIATTEDLRLMEERLCQSYQSGLERLYQSYQSIISIVSTDQRRGDTEDNTGKYNNIYMYKSEDRSLPLKKQYPEQVNRYITALRAATKTPFKDSTEGEFVDAAYELIGWNSTPEQVNGFGSWWEINGHYPGTPALSSLRQEYRDYLRGVIKRQSSNGNSPAAAADEADEAWTQFCHRAVSEGCGTYIRWSGLTPRDEYAIEAIGGKQNFGGEKPQFYRKQFIEAWRSYRDATPTP